MKLNPPASSSDLEVARQIARRLHQTRRRDDPAGASWPDDDAPARARLSPPPLPLRPTSSDRTEGGAALERRSRADSPASPPRPAPAPGSPRDPEATSAAEPTFGSEAIDAQFPTWSEPSEDAEPESELELDGPASEPLPEPDDREPLEDLASPDEPGYDAAAPALEEPELPEVEVAVELDGTEAPGLSPEDLIGEAVPMSSPLEQLTESDDSPFGDALLDAPPAAEESAAPAPSWDEIMESCRALAAASGAMLIDPAGQVFAARGDWPAPGPEQIASKLVAMMAKTLKDAPTRSISAPLMGQHLTAWRVPISEGLMTVAFIGPAPVRADARPGIDSEILTGVRA